MTHTTPQNIPQGYKLTPVGIIPEDWEVKRLGNLLKDSYLGGNYNNYLNSQDGLIPLIKMGNLGRGKINTEILYSIDPNEVLDEKHTLSYNDILFNTRNTLELVGKVAIWKNEYPKAYFNSNILKLIFDEKKIKSNDFINYQLNSYLALKKLRSVATGTTSVAAIYERDLKKIKLSIPPLAEQEKIADCLTTWDTAIEKLSALIEAKKQYKKGLMQQLLTGKKRLDGFSDEWKEVRLGELGTIFNGLTGKTKKDFGKGKPYVTYLNVFNYNKINNSLNFDYVLINENENQNSLEYGDLIFTTSSETSNEVGMSSVLLFQPTDKLYLNSFCFGFRLYDFETLVPEFAVFILRGINFRKEMFKLAQGSTRFNLSKTGFKKITIKLPTLEEQTAIAEILSTADREISLLEKKKAHLETQKQGLMQVLLTGKKRLV